MVLCTGLNCPYQSSVLDVIQQVIYYRDGYVKVTMNLGTGLNCPYQHIKQEVNKCYDQVNYIIWKMTGISDFSYIPNLYMLLILAGDIEVNPGPEGCPCEELKALEKSIKCTECSTEWHLECAGLSGVTGRTLSNLSWKCVVCIALPSSIIEKLVVKLNIRNSEDDKDEEVNLEKVYNEIKSVKKGIEKINSKIQGVDHIPGKPSDPMYSQAVNKQLGTNINKLVKQMNQERREINGEEIKERQKRTIIVRQYNDKNIIDSEHVRKPIYDNFPGVVIRNARTTPGGSIHLELDDEKTADKIIKQWKNNIYGGNKGVIKGNVPKTTGIVKHVWNQGTENQIKEEILNNYDCKEIDFFKKDGKYMGILKITFNTAEELSKAVNDRITIFNQRYIVEEYKFKPRVIKCNKCQKFNHIARLCRSPERCGKCGKDHNTIECTVEPADYSCCHCQGNHETGDKECPTMKNKEEIIKNRSQNV